MCSGQTTKETSSIIHGLISTILAQEEHPMLHLRTPIKTMVSTGTMPRTPVMISRGTMPRTPTMVSTGTMPRTPSSTVSSHAPVNETIDLVSPTEEEETIELSSPDTPTGAGSLSHNSPQ